MCALLNWLKEYESIAIWLEGIALVLIFVWDRFDSREQHEQTLKQLAVSQKQVQASLELVEASHKPFLRFSTTARDAEDAVLEMGGVVGGMVVKCPGGDAEIENVGSGPAINVSYRGIHHVEGATEQGPNGYLIGIVPGEKFAMPIPRGILQNQVWKFEFTYESLSGRKYRTICAVDSLVLTNIKFESV